MSGPVMSFSVRLHLMGFLCAVVLVTGAKAEEPIGTWRFSKADRPVKVVVLGGSIGAWPAGSFAQYFESVCPRIELRNLSKVGYGAPQLRQRYRAQVLRNPGGRPREGFEHWLLYSGGLNSIGSVSITIKETMDTFKMARAAGAKVVAFSLTPWGDDRERRWRDFAGLDAMGRMRAYADYVMGKLPRCDALADFVEPERRTDPNWLPEELPDIGIDLYDCPLRARDAPPRDLEKLGKLWDRNRKLQVAHPDRAVALDAAAAIPQWYLRPELRSFDHIHPNGLGHRLMASSACPSLPGSWGCDCARIQSLTWVKGALVPAVPGP